MTECIFLFEAYIAGSGVFYSEFQKVGSVAVYLIVFLSSSPREGDLNGSLVPHSD